MTHDLLQTDIELAIRLRADQRSDEEIIRALRYRAVDPGQAAQLLEDLRNGKRVTARSVLLKQLPARRRSRATKPAPNAGEPLKTPASMPPVPTEPVPPRPRRVRKTSRLLVRLSLGLAALALVALAFVLYQRSQERTFGPPEPEAPTPPASDTPSAAPVAPASQNTSPAPQLLELQPDGLRIAGNLVTRDTLLPALNSLLGAPTRTNQVAETGAMIYAYDQQGLLLYLQPGGGTNSLVLDCDATGGVNGTTTPFAGSVRIGDREIRPDMDAQALASIAEVGLKESGGSGSVWNGRYHGLDLVFAYLRSPRHLSLIAIDLK